MLAQSRGNVKMRIEPNIDTQPLDLRSEPVDDVVQPSEVRCQRGDVDRPAQSTLCLEEHDIVATQTCGAGRLEPCGTAADHDHSTRPGGGADQFFGQRLLATDG